MASKIKEPKKVACVKKTSSTTKIKKSSAENEEAIKLLQDYIQRVLEDNKAIDILQIDLKGKTTIADSMFIATGTSTRHVTSIAENLQEKLKKKFGISCDLEGTETADWVVLDAFDVIIHIFRPEIREIYNLEKLWGADFSTANYTLYKR